MYLKLGLIAALMSSLTAACSGEDPAGAGGSGGGAGAGGSGGQRPALQVNGTITGPNNMATGKAVVFWSVSSGSPDYGYAYGAGLASDSRYEVTMDNDPPAEAVNSYGLGIGVIGLLPASAVVPEGKLSNADFEKLEILGASTRHAVIWRSPDNTGEGRDWAKAFPAGFSCGRCVPAKEGETFDSFEPIECSEVTVETATDPKTLRGCNWT